MAMTPEETKALAWMDENPRKIYSSSYDDIITDEQANILLSGNFEAFNESIWETERRQSDYPEFWNDWEEDFANAMGHDDWDDVPEDLQEFARENRTTDNSDWLKFAIKNWNGNVTVSIRKEDAPEHEDLIYVPSGYRNSDDNLEPRDQEIARYLIETFDPEIPEGEGTPEDRLQRSLEVVYGGYDMETLVLIGRMNLLEIYDAGKKLTHVTIGPEDAGHLIFYDFSKGCGNMAEFKIRNEVTLPALYEVDGTTGYGVDKCYGFTGQHWRHEIRAVAREEPEAEPEDASPGM